MTNIFFQIESGFPENPIWKCPVSFKQSEQKQKVHFHTTQRLGESPSVFEGRISGLFFACKGGNFPVEVREGSLVLENGTEISPEKAIDLLS